MSSDVSSVISCEGCAICCHGEAVPPFMATELDRLPRALAAGLDDSPAEQAAEQAPGPEGQRAGPCTWLSAEGKCRHYEDRPGVCREFECGGEECLRMRSERKPPAGSPR